MNHEDRGHARISASKMERILSCPGSVVISRGVPDLPETKYAAEGTQAHEMAERILRTGAFPQCAAGSAAADMLFHVAQYTSYVKQRAAATGGNLVIEASLAWEQYPQTGGHADAVIEALDELEVVDLKYGQGIVVDSEQNPQLAFYALLYAPEVPYDSYRLTIVQPRAVGYEGPRTWTVDRTWMLAFKVEVERVLDLVTRMEAGELGTDGHLKDGDHCRWCPAQTICPLKVAAFDWVEQLTDLDPPVIPAGLETAKIAEILAKKDRIEAFLRAVAAEAYIRANAGTEIPGMKLVQSYGNRAWNIPEDEVVALVTSRGYSERAAYGQPELLSPAQVEKLVGKKNVADDATVKPLREVTLVPASDKRPAVSLVSLLPDLD